MSEQLTSDELAEFYAMRIMLSARRDDRDEARRLLDEYLTRGGTTIALVKAQIALIPPEVVAVITAEAIVEQAAEGDEND